MQAGMKIFPPAAGQARQTGPAIGRACSDRVFMLRKKPEKEEQKCGQAAGDEGVWQDSGGLRCGCGAHDAGDQRFGVTADVE